MAYGPEVFQVLEVHAERSKKTYDLSITIDFICVPPKANCGSSASMRKCAIYRPDASKQLKLIIVSEGQGSL
jgi:hypothetical protein